MVPTAQFPSATYCFKVQERLIHAVALARRSCVTQDWKPFKTVSGFVTVVRTLG